MFAHLQHPRKKKEPQENANAEDSINQEDDDDEDITAEEKAMLKEICGFCKGGPEKNKYGEEEDLLSCIDCGNSGTFFSLLCVFIIPPCKHSRCKMFCVRVICGYSFSGYVNILDTPHFSKDHGNLNKRV